MEARDSTEAQPPSPQFIYEVNSEVENKTDGEHCSPRADDAQGNEGETEGDIILAHYTAARLRCSTATSFHPKPYDQPKGKRSTPETPSPSIIFYPLLIETSSITESARTTTVALRNVSEFKSISNFYFFVHPSILQTFNLTKTSKLIWRTIVMDCSWCWYVVTTLKNFLGFVSKWKYKDVLDWRAIGKLTRKDQ